MYDNWNVDIWTWTKNAIVLRSRSPHFPIIWHCWKVVWRVWILSFVHGRGIIRRVLESHDHLSLKLSAKPFVSIHDSSACFHKKPVTGAPQFNIPGLRRLSYSIENFDAERYPRRENCNWNTSISSTYLRYIKRGNHQTPSPSLLFPHLRSGHSTN